MGFTKNRIAQTSQGGLTPTKAKSHIKKRTATVLHVLGEGTLAGLSRHVFDLAYAGRHSAYHPIVAAPLGPLLDVLESAEIPVVPITQIQKPLSTIAELRALYRRVKAEAHGPLIVHLHGGRAGWLGRVAAFGFNLPLVYTEYQWTADAKPAGSVASFFELLGMNLLDSVTSVTIATSQAVADFLIDRGITRAEKLAVVYNGVVPRAVQRHGGAATITIGSVGTLKSGRGFEDLLEAFAKLKKTRAHLRLEIIGDGPGLGALMRLRDKLKLGESAEFYHFLPDLTRAFGRWSIYVHPHRHDSFGQALLEAMRTGLPVVATKIAGTPEVVIDGTTGILVPPAKPALLADALAQLVRDSTKRRAMGQAGNARVRESFDLSKMVQETFSVYEVLRVGRQP